MTQQVGKTKQRVLQVLADFATVVLISTAFLLCYLLVHPFARGFYCSDETIRFPYKPDTVPLWVAGAYGVFGGIFFVIVAELYLAAPCCRDEQHFDSNQNRFILNTLHGVLLYSLGAISTLLITEVGKHTIGRLRPHFFDVCRPVWEQLDCYSSVDGVQVANYVQYREGLCTGNPKLVREARLSFPSGHTSFTTYSMAFIIIYLEARLTLQRTRFIKSIIQLTAFIAAWHTAMSRVSDFKHHYTDVMAGAAIGLSVAVFVTVITGKKIWHHSQRDKNLQNSLDRLPDGSELEPMQHHHHRNEEYAM
jgi:phosphatidate phosphatase